MEDFKAARSQKVRSYLAKKIRDTKKEEKAAASIFSLCSGKKVFISTIQAAPSLVLDQHMDKLGAKYESSLLRADAFVVPDVTDPAEETLWHAFLSGGLLLSPQAFSHGEGPAVKYCCAVSIRRTVYISSGFQEENPDLCAAITGRMLQCFERHAFVSSICKRNFATDRLPSLSLLSPTKKANKFCQSLVIPASPQLVYAASS